MSFTVFKTQELATQFIHSLLDPAALDNLQHKAYYFLLKGYGALSTCFFGDKCACAIAALPKFCLSTFAFIRLEGSFV